MQIVLKKMVTDILPMHAIRDNYHMPSTVPAYHVLMETFGSVLHQGSIDLKSMHRMEHLLNVGGEQWFCEHLVRVSVGVVRPYSDLLCFYLPDCILVLMSIGLNSNWNIYSLWVRLW